MSLYYNVLPRANVTYGQTKNIRGIRSKTWCPFINIFWFSKIFQVCAELVEFTCDSTSQRLKYWEGNNIMNRITKDTKKLDYVILKNLISYESTGYF